MFVLADQIVDGLMNGIRGPDGELFLNISSIFDLICFVFWIVNVSLISTVLVKCGNVKELFSKKDDKLSQDENKKDELADIVDVATIKNWQIYAIMSFFAPLIFSWVLFSKVKKVTTLFLFSQMGMSMGMNKMAMKMNKMQMSMGGFGFNKFSSAAQNTTPTVSTPVKTTIK